MKISLYILADRLKEYDPEITVREGGIHISEVRLYNGKEEAEPQVLYIAAEERFHSSGSKRIMCKNKTDYLLLQTEDLADVLNRILEVFSFFARWEEDCTKRIREGCSLSDILNNVEVLMRRPVQVVDGAQVIIGYSCGLAELYSDDEWKQMIRSSGLPADVLGAFNKKYLNTFEQKETFYIPVDFFPTASWCRHIFMDDARFATLIVLVTGGELTKGELQMIELATDQVRRWIEVNNQSDETAKSTSYLARLLDGMPKAAEELETQLESVGWGKECRKQLYVASFISQYFYLEALLSHLLSEHSSGIYAIPYRQALVILCNLDLLNAADFKEELQEFLMQNNYYAAYSMPYRELSQTAQAYHQALKTLELSEAISGILYSCTENAMQYITGIVRESSSLDLIHPVVNEIKQFDQQHHTDYYETLFTYLKNERNHQITSRELFIHRNTLFKRLKKIEELWPLDYENADLRFYLLYSFYQDHYDL